MCPAVIQAPANWPPAYKQLLRCQYLYVCVSKANKLSSGSHPGAGELAPCISSSGVSICTFVLVKQVNCAVIQAPANRPPAAPQVSVPLQRLLRCQCFRQHTSAYVSIRQHTSAYASTFTLQRLLRCQCFGTLVPVSKYFVLVKQVN